VNNETPIPSTLKLTRQQRFAEISKQKQWDVIVIGGGITGAGILKLASQCGLKVLLIEQKDFAWGSSSRSSKMVHGGLRYIAEGDFKLTQESVIERQRLLNDAPSLVTKQSFAMSHFQKKFPPAWLFNSLLSIYDMFSGKKQHQYWQQLSFQLLVPNSVEKLNTQHKANGGTQFTDAMTDDARLVLRLIQEAQELGAHAINYVKVEKLIYQQQNVRGVIAKDTASLTECKNQTLPASISLNAKIVINATGAWASELLANNEIKNQAPVTMRPLRGSHLIVPSWRLPVASAISVMHQTDNRPVQIFPWQNVTVIGTTDILHQQPLSIEPSISQEEVDYLLMAINQQLPNAKIIENDIISTFSGIRPVVNYRATKNISGKTTKPSQEKREHSIWESEGLITVAGGKLTTFRKIAEQVILKTAKTLSDTLPNLEKRVTQIIAKPIFEPLNNINSSLPTNVHQKLLGCYGQLMSAHIHQATTAELQPISYSNTLWSELIWALKYEQVNHLDDLLLRRSRIGNVLANGALGFQKEIKQLCQKYLKWDDKRWSAELLRYQYIWSSHYSLPSVRASAKITMSKF